MNFVEILRMLRKIFIYLFVSLLLELVYNIFHIYAYIRIYIAYIRTCYCLIG